MKIVSTTLTGDPNARIIGEALRSVAPIVDSSLVIWTGAPDGDGAVFDACAAVGSSFEIAYWPWRNDFGAARQAALDFARSFHFGAGWMLGSDDWSTMADDDERVICPDPAALRAYLAALPAEVQIVCAFTASGVLQRERFFRGDIKARWYLRTHETIDVTPEQQATVPASIITWDELPKSAADIEMRCKRDLDLLALDLIDHPNNPRVLYYIGQANEHLWRNEEALAAYRRVSDLCGGEAAAWACYCAARIHMREPADPLAAYGACIAAIAREPRMAEPYHLAGAICVDGGRPEWGEAFGEMAKIHGEGTPGAAVRGGFRWPHALGAGPDQVIAQARAAMAAARGIGAVADSVETSGERRVVEMVRARAARIGRPAIVFDVGANRGQWARMARGVLGSSAEIHCFEPGHVSREIGPDVTEHVHETALGNEDGTTFLRWDFAGSGLASLHVRPGQTDSGRVNIQRIDEWCPYRKIARIDLLKIDVEGHEIHVLRGASGMLETGKIDAIQFEFGGACVDSRIFLRDFFDLLVPHGFEIHRVTPTGTEGPIVYSEREEIFVSSNFLAVKRGTLTKPDRNSWAETPTDPAKYMRTRPPPATDPVRALVFSRDRPMQLDACLRSLRMHCRDAAALPVHVLFRWTSQEYAQAYREAAAANPWAIFVPEVDFEADARALLAGCDHVLFVVDDSIFVRGLSVGETVAALDARPDAIGFSLRLGFNCVTSYPNGGASQMAPQIDGTAHEESISFKWPGADGDWGYPLEVSSSLYRTIDVLSVLAGRRFRNPNELEATMAEVADRSPVMRSVRARLLCAPLSLAFSVPCNRVQSTHANRVGADPGQSAEALLRGWQDGWRIKIEEHADYVPNACHEEVTYTFERRTTVGPTEFSRVAPTEQRVEVVAAPISITVTSTGKSAGAWAGRCIESVARQTLSTVHRYIAADAETFSVLLRMENPAARGRLVAQSGIGQGLLANLLPIWRSLPPEEVIVWLDGDDWLATDRALDRVAAAHGAGALVTYGSFMYSDGRPGFAGQCGTDPRSEPWRATHLKSFRAGLVQRIRDEDLRWLDGPYLDLAIDQAVMLPVLEMAGRDRSVFIPEILAVYNEPHGFAANADAGGLAREAEAVRLVRGRKRYERIARL